jgi:hypothetical protein
MSFANKIFSIPDSRAQAIRTAAGTLPASSPGSFSGSNRASSAPNAKGSSELFSKTQCSPQLAQVVLRISDAFQNQNSQTPWSDALALPAYLAYFYPLNYARIRAVIAEGAKLGFFDDIEQVHDFGSGPGVALHALFDSKISIPWSRISASDIYRGYEDLQKKLRLPLDHQTTYFEEPSKRKIENGLLVASYALNELSDIPASWWNYDAWMLIEPSTRYHARRLMKLKTELVSKGYKIYAPCTHQGACPLIVDSEKDWCHSRIQFAGPDWWQALEAQLPMKNRTITYSYLLARRVPASAKENILDESIREVPILPDPVTKIQHDDRSENLPGDSAQQRSAKTLAAIQLTRLIGDTLFEKGKSRQMVCRSERREFISWFPQRIKGLEKEYQLPRGGVIELIDMSHLDEKKIEQNSTEIKIKDPRDLKIPDN